MYVLLAGRQQQVHAHTHHIACMQASHSMHMHVCLPIIQHTKQSIADSKADTYRYIQHATPTIMHNKPPHRLLSATFLHAGLLHLGLNCYALYALGTEVEAVMGYAVFLTIYLLSGMHVLCLQYWI